jgi:RHS repeat-associated protein
MKRALISSHVLLLATMISAFSASIVFAGNETSYTNWPDAAEWVDLTNDLWQTYQAIVDRCYGNTNGFDAPSYVWPMDDYRRFAAKIEEMCPRFVCQTNAGEDGHFHNYRPEDPTVAEVPMWTVSNLYAYCQISNSCGELGWYLDQPLDSWAVVDHRIQQQVVTALTVLAWTTSGSIDSDEESTTTKSAKGYGVDWVSAVADQSAAWAGEDWRSTSESWYSVQARISDRSASGKRMRWKLPHSVSDVAPCSIDVYYLMIAPLGSGVTFYDLDGLGATENALCYHETWPSINPPVQNRGGEAEATFPGSETNPVELVLNPSPGIDQGVECDDMLLIMKWEFPSIPDPVVQTNKPMPDTDRDDIVDIGADLESFGADSGTIVFRSHQDEPYVVLPIAKPPLWYGGLPVHAYIAQGGHTNLPFHYLIPELTDDDGYYQSYSLNTRVVESGFITNECQKTKQASVLRPRGNLVVFDFAWDESEETFSAMGYPIDANSNRTYCLHDITTNDHTDLQYDLYFESGITHRFGAGGGITEVSDVNGHRSAATSGSIPGASVTFTNSTPIVATNAKYNVALTWSGGLVREIAYSAKDMTASNTTLIAYDDDGWITGLSKTGVTCIDLSDVSVSDDTITYSWGTVARSETGPAGEATRSVTLTTSIEDCGAVQEETTFDELDRVTAYEVTANDDTATTSYEYSEGVGRYANGFPKAAKLRQITYPDDSVVEYAYDADTGWLTSETLAVGNGADRVTEYSYDRPTGDTAGDIADITNLVERPRIVVNRYDGEVIGRALYSYSGAATTIVQQCTSSAANWDHAGNLITTNVYYTQDLLKLRNGLLTSSLRPAENSSYDYEVTGLTGGDFTSIGKLTTSSDHSTGETIIHTVNAFGITESSTTTEEGHQIAYVNSTVDAFGRIYTTDYIDGTAETNEAYGLYGPTAVTERDGSSTLYSYNNVGGVTRIIRDGLGRTTEFQYDGLGNVTEVTEIGGIERVATEHDYDAQGRPTRMKDLLGTTSYRYEKELYGLKTTTTDPRGTTVEERYKDGSVKRIYGSAVVAETEYAYSAVDEEFITKETRGTTDEWKETYFNLLGKPGRIKRNVPGGTETTISYDNQGRRTLVKDENNVQSVCTYSSKNEIQNLGHDVNGDSDLAASGTDRFSTANTVVSAEGVEHQSYVYPTAGSSVSNLLSSVRTSLDGRTTTSVYAGRTAVVGRSGYAGTGRYFVTNNFSDGTYIVSKYEDWRLKEVKKHDKQAVLVEREQYNYDGLGALTSIVNSRKGTTTIRLDSKRRINSITLPDPEKQPIVRTYYPGTTRVVSETRTDGSSVRYDYYENGLVKNVYGGAAYRTTYEYDNQGRRTKMKTWHDRNTSVDTEWTYDNKTGLLDQKKINGQTVKTYAYRDNGQISSVQDAEGVVETFSYHPTSGDIVSRTWSDGTSGIRYEDIDRLGRVGRKICGGNTNQYVHMLDNQVAVVTCKGAVIPGSVLSYEYGTDHAGVESITRELGGMTDVVAVARDDAMRVAAITNGLVDVEYKYSDEYAFVTNVVLSTNRSNLAEGSVEWDVTNSRINSITWDIGASTVGYTYEYMPGSDRIHKITLADGTYWEYGYDSKDQLLSGRRYNADGSDYLGMQFGYDYDEAGNTTKSGFLRANGEPAHVFGADSFNLHINRVWSNQVELVGRAVTGSGISVSVNNTPCVRDGETFRCLLTVDNSQASVETNICVYVVSNDVVAVVSGTLFVAKCDEVVVNRDTGVIGQDSRYSYGFDGFGRLTNVVSVNAEPDFKEEYTYLADGRRATKTFYEYSGGWVAVQTNTYAYDGWNLVHERIITANATTDRYYLWGLDLVGQRTGRWGQESGGIGGLLAITEVLGSTTNYYFPISDHNGNIHHVIDSSGTIVANYEYSSFGVLIGKWGEKADLCPFRFQSKYYDEQTELYYFGYRYYDPASTKWLSRDPKGEEGGINLTAFCRNDPLNNYDPLGLFDLPTHANVTISSVRKMKKDLGLTDDQFHALLRGAVEGSVYPDLQGRIRIPKHTPLRLMQSWDQFEAFIGWPAAKLEAAGDWASERLGDLQAWGIGLVWKDYPRLRRGVKNWWKHEQSFAAPSFKWLSERVPEAKPFYETHWGGATAWQHGMMGSAQDTPSSVESRLVCGTEDAFAEFRRFTEEGNYYDAGFALGKILHYLQDTHTPSHLRRDPKTGLITAMYDYNSQSPSLHGDADKPGFSHPVYKNAVSRTQAMVLLFMSGDAKDIASFYQLAPGATIGGGGPFAFEGEVIPPTDLLPGR